MADVISRYVDSELLHDVFEPKIHEDIYLLIKFRGVKRTEKEMIEHGYHPSFVRAAIRRIMRHRGW